MSCGRRPVYRNVGPTSGHCLLSDTNNDQCPPGYVDDSFVKIPRTVALERGGPFCAQDIFDALGADTSRFRKRCRKTQWDQRNRLNCCLGAVNNDTACSPEWCFESKACDTVISNFCRNPANHGNPKCGCLLPQSAYEETLAYGPPECVDKRCASNPQAYQTERQRNRRCEITNCIIGGDVSIGAENNLDTQIIAQQCGPRFQDLRQQPQPSGPGFFDRVAQHIRSNQVAYGIGAGVVLLGAVVGGGYYALRNRNKT